VVESGESFVSKLQVGQSCETYLAITGTPPLPAIMRVQVENESLKTAICHDKSSDVSSGCCVLNCHR
jgi:hypothetical protein